MNKTIIIGRLTATPEIKVTPSGIKVCSFTVAVERKFKGADEKPVADFIDCVAWRHTAEFLCKWFDKGVRVAVVGELQTRVYEDKDTNKKIKVCEVVASDIEFADGKTQMQTRAAEQSNTNIGTTNELPSANDFIEMNGDASLPF